MSMSMLRHSMDVYVMPSATQGSLLTKKQQGTKDSDRRAGVAKLCPGDKVLVKLDAYWGAHQKLVNRWSSILHTVVRCVADDVPAYVIENTKGDRKVIHQARLLLWLSCDEDLEGLQMTVDQLTIFVSLSALEPLDSVWTWPYLNRCWRFQSWRWGPRPQRHAWTCRRRKELANGGSLGGNQVYGRW